MKHDVDREPKPRKKAPRKRLENPFDEGKPKLRVGLFSAKRHGGRLSPCHRKDPFPGVFIDALQAKGMNDDDVIVYALDNDQEPRLVKNLGSIHLVENFSKMSAYAYNLPHEFDNETLTLADSLKIPELGDRTDLRSIPFVTIDGADAKDFDDAVFAESDEDPRNAGGWRAIVAIADVCHYVLPGDKLDREARKRGNSVYFVDKVTPMLPEKLSNDLCSLKPKEDRACLAVDMIVSKDGKLKSYRFKRALIRSKARLTYERVEDALNGKPDETSAPLLDSVIKPLYGCYLSLKKARDNRGTINVESSENDFKLNADGTIASVTPKKRMESHKIIEELMILANVAAAKTLQAKDWPCAYRVHDHPDHLRLRALSALAKNFKIQTRKFSATNVVGVINEMLEATRATPYARLFNELTLRSQAQARYSPDNTGHFGLNLAHYCHFTSPIRRYADILVHRALVTSLGLDGAKQRHSPDFEPDLKQICDRVSLTERVAMEAERETRDRFMAHYLKDRLGEVFDGTIIGVGIPGLFVELDEIGAQGFIPKQELSGDFFAFHEIAHCYTGKRTKRTYRLGDRVRVSITNADPIACSIGFALREETKPKKAKNTLEGLEGEGADAKKREPRLAEKPKRRRRRRGKHSR